MTAGSPPQPEQQAEPEPPPLVLVPLGPPQFYASYLCPNCQRVRRFKTRYPQPGDLGEHLCQCGRLLGIVIEGKTGMTLIRLTCGA